MANPMKRSQRSPRRLRASAQFSRCGHRTIISAITCFEARRNAIPCRSMLDVPTIHGLPAPSLPESTTPKAHTGSPSITATKASLDRSMLCPMAASSPRSSNTSSAAKFSLRTFSKMNVRSAEDAGMNLSSANGHLRHDGKDANGGWIRVPANEEPVTIPGRVDPLLHNTCVEVGRNVVVRASVERGFIGQMIEVRTHVEPTSLVHDDAHRMNVFHAIPDLLLGRHQRQRLEVRGIGKADMRSHGRWIQSDSAILDDGDGQCSTSLDPAVGKDGHTPTLQPRQARYSIPRPCPAEDSIIPIKRWNSPVGSSFCVKRIRVCRDSNSKLLPVRCREHDLITDIRGACEWGSRRCTHGQRKLVSAIPHGST